MKNILALDLGTKTGWAYRDHDGLLRSGNWDLSDMHRTRWVALQSLLLIHIPPECRIVVVEKPIIYPKRPASTRVGVGLATVVEAWADVEDLEYSEIPPATVKKVATGHGHAKKPTMLKMMRREFPDQEIDSYDQADALAVLYTYEEMSR